MLFNSYVFVFAFLPVTVGLFYAFARRLGISGALALLVVASLFFYSWWNPIYLPLILASMGINYAIGRYLSRDGVPAKKRRTLVTLAVIFNLALLGVFKYSNFFVDTVNYVGGTNIYLRQIALPLAISFFTFQQIGFVVECYRSESHCPTLGRYLFFVSFFPQLIAGPIVRSEELFPQLKPTLLRFNAENFAVGLSLFFFGLFKKVVIADNVAKFSSPAFDALHQHVPTTGVAWLAIFAYSLQLYFDFSGYSDMAIGLARMFNITLPFNFDSPYKAQNVGDFWRRWHVTLSRFLKDYLYIPLGGNRGAEWRTQYNLLLTMVLGGMWHGAGWGFVLWGFVNGMYLLIYKWYRRLTKPFRKPDKKPTWLGREAAITLTFVCIMLSRVSFRAPDWQTTVAMWKSLLGITGGGLTLSDVLELKFGLLICVLVYLISRYSPNTQEIMASYKPALGKVVAHRLRWAPNVAWGCVVALLGLASLLSLSEVSEFLYFQF
jgi:D-alanyl-lipoteichoic acid acyltransferase DltB (MBOAT superfamily)